MEVDVNDERIMLTAVDPKQRFILTELMGALNRRGIRFGMDSMTRGPEVWLAISFADIAPAKKD